MKASPFSQEEPCPLMHNEETQEDVIQLTERMVSVPVTDRSVNRQKATRGIKEIKPIGKKVGNFVSFSPRL